MAEEEEVPDLLIFSKRKQGVDNLLPAVPEKPHLPQPESTNPQHYKSAPAANRPQPKPTPVSSAQAKSNPAPVPKYIPMPVAKPEPESKAHPKQAEELFPAHASAQPTPSDMVGSGSLNMSESLKFAKGQFCANHPWRHAYAVCSVCKLPFCYIEIMEDNGKLYCLNDINMTIAPSSVTGNSSMNSFSILSCVLLIANSIVLGYFMYPQAKFLTETLLASGSIRSMVFVLLHISNLYYIPLGNIAIAILGLLAAITVMRKSLYGFGFSLLIAFCGLLLVLYEYLNSSDTYLFASSALLLVSITSLTYSRMTSTKEVAENKSLAPDIEWPKPEAF